MPKLREDAPKLIDEAFAKLPPDIKAICIKLRVLIHTAVPGIKEDWKWGPNFNCNGMVCGIWGFKGHASLVFYNGAAMSDKHKLFNYGEENEKNRMVKFTDIKQVKDKQVIDYLKESARLNEKGIKPPKLPIKVIVLPDDVQDAFASVPAAKEVFESFAYSHKKEYIDYISEAKRLETRKSRIEKTIAMLLEKRSLYDKYKK